MIEVKTETKTYFYEIDPTKVKPCPFCGSVGIEMCIDAAARGWQVVVCLECSASIEVRVIPAGRELTPEEINRQTFERGLDLWNIRAEYASRNAK